MMRKTAFFAAAMLASLAPAAQAEDDGHVGDTKEVVLDPKASYLIVQTNSASSMFSFGLTFLRRPTDADISDYIARRAAALAKAREKWSRKHARWAEDAARWDAMPAKARTKPRPVEPVEPTDANLAFAPIDRENMVQIGPFNRFAKKDGRSTFVTRVKPGRYAFYGPIIFNAAAAGGTCMCMGTIEFEIPEGTIVNAGMMKLNWFEEREKAKAEGRPLPKTTFDLPPDISAVGWELPSAAAIADPRLAAYRIVPAQFRAAGPFPNYFGIMVDRLTAIPGVLTYRRDQIIDGASVTTEAVIPPTPATLSPRP